jgi:plastocyanin
MRRLMLVAAGVPALALALASAGAPAGVSVVSITAKGFDPQTISIHAGETVTWTNTTSAQHQVVSSNDAFKPSPILQAGQSFSFTFPSQGRFGYHDLQSAVTGVVQVQPAGPSVTIGAGRGSVPFAGTGTTLTGRVSSGKARETVQVFARPCGRVGTAQVATVATTRNGSWRLVVRPERTTAYGARWGVIPSPAVAVAVMPRMHLVRSGGAYLLRLTAGAKLIRRTVVLQRWDETQQTWQIVTSAKLKDGGVTALGAFVAKAALKSPAGGRVRAFISASQAAPCYGAGPSNVLG